MRGEGERSDVVRGDGGAVTHIIILLLTVVLN